jgi:MerR family transcriptional regulator/heat shock protein HspR
MREDYREPLYTIGIAAKLIGVCPATLRIWEKKGLIRPKRLGKNRYYSKCDIDRLEYIKDLIQRRRINIKGVKTILNTMRCWEVKKCHPKERDVCPVYVSIAKNER